MKDEIMRLADYYAWAGNIERLDEARAALEAAVTAQAQEIERLKSSNESYITLANTAYEITDTLRAELEAAKAADVKLEAIHTSPSYPAPSVKLT